MKFQAFTLVEGVVTMIILSLILSFTLVVGFNLLTSFPSQNELNSQFYMEQSLDSLLKVGQSEPVTYRYSNYDFSYSIERFYDLDSVWVARVIFTDSVRGQFKIISRIQINNAY